MTVPRLGETLPARRFGPIDAAWVGRYADASLDRNPIHRDAAAAQAAGFPGPILPGMLLLGLCERVLRQWRPDLPIAHLSGRFLAPLIAPADVEVSGRVALVEPDAVPPRAVLRLFVRPVGGTAPACVAEAWLRLSAGAA